MDRHTGSAFERLEIVETGRRRRWSAAAKERIVLESMAGPRQITATARRHNISRSLLLIWRRSFVAQGEAGVAGFVPAVVTPDARTQDVDVGEDARRMSIGSPSSPAAPVPSVPVPGRTEIVLVSGRRIIVEGALDTDAVLKLARGLETLR